MTKALKLDLKTAPLSLLVAMAKSLARDIDRGLDNGGSLRSDLEEVFSLIPTAREVQFA